MIREIEFSEDEECLIRLTTDSTKKTLTVEAFYNYIEGIMPIVLSKDELKNELGLEFAVREYKKTVKVSDKKDVPKKKPKQKRLLGSVHFSQREAEKEKIEKLKQNIISIGGRNSG